MSHLNTGFFYFMSQTYHSNVYGTIVLLSTSFLITSITLVSSFPTCFFSEMFTSKSIKKKKKKKIFLCPPVNNLDTQIFSLISDGIGLRLYYYLLILKQKTREQCYTTQTSTRVGVRIRETQSNPYRVCIEIEDRIFD